ncbi:MAG TPA: FAD:protein FMN transferase [Planctomycetaceae bacterium]|nr:FAD:protein FMN transferase [Planctomycetaceae bacterium]
MNDQFVTEITRRAMATEFAIILPGQSPRDTEAAIDALDLLEKIESKLTIYSTDSEISRINQSAGKQPLHVSNDVFQLIAQAISISEQTGGAFDITAGPLIECWGFTKRRGQKPTDQQIETARMCVGWQQVELNHQEKTVFLKLPGMKINLGGIGKGYAIDRLADHLRQNAVNQFLIHGGKSTILASTDKTNPQAEPWKIAIQHPLRPTRRLTEIEISNGAIGTSGSGKQFFHHKGKRIGHVIDPRTGRPAGDALSLTIQTKNATNADAYSTACFVEGLHATETIVRMHQSQCKLGNETDGPYFAVAIKETTTGNDVEVIELGAIVSA